MSLISNAITTVTRLCEFMDIPVPAESSVAYRVLEAYVNSVTGWVENYIGFRPKKTTYTNEMYNTDGSQTLLLNNFPIDPNSNFTIQMRDSALNEDEWETIDQQYYHVDYSNGMVTGAGGWKFSKTTNGYRVSYTAGYDYDNVSTFLSDTAGGGLELACWLLCQDMYNKRGVASNVQSERIGAYAVTYAKNSGIGVKTIMENPQAQELLDGYAKVELPVVVTPNHY